METGYAVYIHAVGEGRVPLVRDESGKPYLFSTERAAQLDIAHSLVLKLQEFIDGPGDRTFNDAIEVEEYVQKIGILPDGSIQLLEDEETA